MMSDSQKVFPGISSKRLSHNAKATFRNAENSIFQVQQQIFIEFLRSQINPRIWLRSPIGNRSSLSCNDSYI